MGDKQVAVKIVLPAFSGQLEKEFNALKKFEKAGLPLVQPASHFVFGKAGAGYAMTPSASGHVVRSDLLKKVGKCSIVEHAFRCLAQLHKGGLVHGDPRSTTCIVYVGVLY